MRRLGRQSWKAFYLVMSLVALAVAAGAPVGYSGGG
jgi:hypothetical protein